MTPDYDQGILDQANADIPALRSMERWGVEQYHRAERAIGELCEMERKRNRMMVAAYSLLCVCVVLTAILVARIT
jgi:hypothetical protein